MVDGTSNKADGLLFLILMIQGNAVCAAAPSRPFRPGSAATAGCHSRRRSGGHFSRPMLSTMTRVGPVIAVLLIGFMVERHSCWPECLLHRKRQPSSPESADRSNGQAARSPSYEGTL